MWVKLDRGFINLSNAISVQYSPEPVQTYVLWQGGGMDVYNEPDALTILDAVDELVGRDRVHLSMEKQPNESN